MLDLSILGVTMRMAAPILLAGTGTLYNDRAGVTNITLEGSMLLGGFFAVACSYFTGSWVLATLAGIGTGVIISLVFHFLTSVCGGDELVVGFSMNILLDGLSIFLLKQIFHQSGSLVDDRIVGMPQISSEALESIPVLGTIFNGQTWIVFFTFLFCSAYLGYSVSDALWAESAGLRRKTPSGCYCWNKGPAYSFPVQYDQWSNVRFGGCADFSWLFVFVYTGNDGWTWIYCFGRSDFFQGKSIKVNCDYSVFWLCRSGFQSCAIDAVPVGVGFNVALSRSGGAHVCTI